MLRDLVLLLLIQHYWTSTARVQYSDLWRRKKSKSPFSVKPVLENQVKSNCKFACIYSWTCVDTAIVIYLQQMMFTSDLFFLP